MAEILLQLKQLLGRILKNELDKFEVLATGRKFEVDFGNTSGIFSLEKYSLQYHIVREILKYEVPNSNPYRYHAALLEDTKKLLELEKVGIEGIRAGAILV